MSRRGARPIEDRLRLVLAVMDALSREGSVIDADGVAHVLGIPIEEAVSVIADVMEAALGADVSGGVVLPLEGDAEEGLRLLGGTRPIRALRMTRSEAQAMVETLDALGVDDGALGGIRPKIARALFPVDMVDGGGPSAAGGMSDALRGEGELPSRLVTCLDALYCNRGLSFTYLGERGVPTARLVEPLSVRYLFGQWVLDALDLRDGAADGGEVGEGIGSIAATGLGDPDVPVTRSPSDVDVLADAGASASGSVEASRSVEEGVSRETPKLKADRDLLDHRRFFLAERLRDIRSLDLPRTHPELRNLPWHEGGQWVRLYFTDRRRYDGHDEWTWSREVPRGRLKAREKRRIDPDGCAVDVRHFPGSPYLARLVVACAGTCTTDDPALLADIREYLDALP